MMFPSDFQKACLQILHVFSPFELLLMHSSIIFLFLKSPELENSQSLYLSKVAPLVNYILIPNHNFLMTILHLLEIGRTNFSLMFNQQEKAISYWLCYLLLHFYKLKAFTFLSIIPKVSPISDSG